MSLPFTGILGCTPDLSDPVAEQFDLGIINTYRSSKTVSLDPFNYPDTDAREQEYYDAEGSHKKISISGEYIGSTWGDVIEWKERTEAIANGYTFDNGIDMWLAIYIPNFYGTGRHLWVERYQAPLLEMAGTTPTIDGENERLAMDDADNLPICVTLVNIEVELISGTSPMLTYSMELTQRYPTYDPEA